MGLKGSLTSSTITGTVSNSSLNRDYNEMSNKPKINGIELIGNKTGADLGLNSGSSFSGSYNDLTDKPSIPSKTSELTNDSGFVTETYVTNEINSALGDISTRLAALTTVSEVTE